MSVIQDHLTEFKYPKIDSYLDDFQFSQVKKYLGHKSPVCYEVITDSMYPLFKFGDHLSIKKNRDSWQKSRMGVFLLNGKLEVGYIKSCANDKVIISFLKKERKEINIDLKFVLGEASFHSNNPFKKIKLFLTVILKLRIS